MKCTDRDQNCCTLSANGQERPPLVIRLELGWGGKLTYGNCVLECDPGPLTDQIPLVDNPYHVE